MEDTAFGVAAIHCTTDDNRIETSARVTDKACHCLEGQWLSLIEQVLLRAPKQVLARIQWAGEQKLLLFVAN